MNNGFKHIFIEFDTVDDDRYGYQYIKPEVYEFDCETELIAILSAEISRQIDREILNTLMITADKMGTNEIAMQIGYRPKLPPKFINLDFRI